MEFGGFFSKARQLPFDQHVFNILHSYHMCGRELWEYIVFLRRINYATLLVSTPRFWTSPCGLNHMLRLSGSRCNEKFPEASYKYFFHSHSYATRLPLQNYYDKSVTAHPCTGYTQLQPQNYYDTTASLVASHPGSQYAISRFTSTLWSMI